MSAVRVRPASEVDREVVVETFVQGFVDDPVLRFFFPDDTTYPPFASAFFGFLVELNLDGGEISLTAGGEVAALWTPPGVRGCPRRRSRSVGRRRWCRACPMMRWSDWIASRWPASGWVHWMNCATWACSPPVPTIVDADTPVRCWPRSSNVTTATASARTRHGHPRTFPSTRFGFRVHAETDIEDGPHLWSLVRDARAPSATPDS